VLKKTILYCRLEIINETPYTFRCMGMMWTKRLRICEKLFSYVRTILCNYLNNLKTKNNILDIGHKMLLSSAHPIHILTLINI
jgi:hypothetical protein